jgi:8-amino-7-oxononanoate synthase
MESPVGPRVMIDGREVDYFAGTGYLGLQSDPAVVLSARQALEQYGFSTGASRGGFGEHPIYNELEREACAYFGAEKVLYFASGYLGAAILTQATSKRFDHIFIDSAAHFSLWDAAQATNKPITPFRHLKVEHLEACLERELSPLERPLVLSDGIFPISGEIAPLPGYLTLVKHYGGQVYLDDAHAVGVLGAHGRGTPEYFGVDDEDCRTSATLAKALGGYGGVIWGEAAWVDAVERDSRICVGASPPPLVVAAASASALALARARPDLRERLWANVARLRAGLRVTGWDLEETPVPIICLAAREGVNLPSIQARLFEMGLAVEYERAYTSTPAGGALRIAVFATHSAEQIDRLINGFRQVI